MINTFELTAALEAMGDAELFVGDPFVSGGLDPLGLFEGELRLETGFNLNTLTTERTGDIPHQVQVTPGAVAIVGSLALGDPALWAKISPLGAKGLGHSRPQAVQETSALLIPRSEVGAGLTYATGAWSPAAPENAIWLWRCFISHGAVPFRYAEGGKVLTEVRITAMFDAARPEGQKVYTIGDPAAQGITTIAI